MVFEVVTASVAAAHRELAERRVDLAVHRRTEALIEDNMVVEDLFDYDWVVVAEMQNPWTRRRRIELAELADEPWVLPPPNSPIGTFTADAFRASGLRPPRAAVITLSLNLLYRLLRTGRFLTVLPRFIVEPSSKHLPLKALSVDLPNARGTVSIVTLKNRTLSPLAELFIKAARAVTKPLAKAK